MSLTLLGTFNYLNLYYSTNVNGTLYFTAQDATNGQELWKLDSTGAATLVQDIYSGSNGSYPQNLTNVNGTLYFTAQDATNGQELWKVDSTGAATMVSTGMDYIQEIKNVNGQLLVTNYNYSSGQLELYSLTTAPPNNAPVITSGQSYSINENTKNATVVGTVAATDVENDSLSNWTITNGNTGNGFAINPTTGVITVNDSTALDFETNPIFNLTLTVSDGTDTSLGQTITINLKDLNEITYTAGVDNGKGTTGNDYADLLAGNDRFNAGGGNDVADGGNGADLIFGGIGKDELYGGIGSDRLYGDSGNDVLNGNAGNDILFGGTGKDTLNGDAGNDILYGDGGADTFVLNSGEGRDTIRDYQVGIDTISKGVGLSVTLAQSGSNVLIKEGSDVLATVLGVTTGQLSYLV